MVRVVRWTLAMVVLVVFAASVRADVPNTMNVQGRLTDASGTPLPAGSKTLTFKIFDAEVAGNEIWPFVPGEDHSVTSDAEGRWTATIGTTIPIPEWVFEDTVRWLEVTVNDGVNPVTTLPRVRLATGPYAYRVGSVNGASGGTITTKLAIGPGTTNNGDNAFAAGENNTANGNYSTISGGFDNAATGSESTVGGGSANTAGANNATIAGGSDNAAPNGYATVGGGYADSALAAFATIAGGISNTAYGSYSTIGGGRNNRTDGLYTVVAGGGGTQLADSNLASGDYSAVGGGRRNITTGVHAVIAGGEANSGAGNNAFIGGGFNNQTFGNFSTIGGGQYNYAAWLGATIGGGAQNSARGWMGTIGGGAYNQTDSGGTVGGGSHNYARSLYSVVAGGGGPAAADSNCVTPDAYLGVIGGGRLNLVKAGYGTIGGGSNNEADGFASTIAGGWINSATGNSAATGGGEYNLAGGSYSTVPGGSHNEANGMYSFAAGRRAKASFNGSFVWADQTDADFTSTNDNQFLIRASGNVGINTNNPRSPLHVFSQDIWRPSSGNGWGDFNVGNGTYGLCVGVALGGGGAGTVHIWPKGNAEQIIFASPTTGDLMIIKKDGHVGIGEFSAPNILTLPNVNSVGGRALAYAWDTYSSRRWKENIKPIDNALEKVRKLRGVEYDSQTNGAHDIGVIAEEVGAVLPEIVTYEDNGVDARSVEYAKLVAVLIEAVKEQQVQIDKLQTELEQLRE